MILQALFCCIKKRIHLAPFGFLVGVAPEVASAPPPWPPASPESEAPEVASASP